MINEGNNINAQQQVHEVVSAVKPQEARQTTDKKDQVATDKAPVDSVTISTAAQKQAAERVQGKSGAEDVGETPNEKATEAQSGKKT